MSGSAMRAAWLHRICLEAFSSFASLRSPLRGRLRLAVSLRSAVIRHSAFCHSASRRAFLTTSGLALGAVALDALLARDLSAAEKYRGLAGLPHHPPKAKRVIYLYMSGGPSHLETFDYKPGLDKLDGQPMPESFTKNQPIAQLQGAKLKVPLHMVTGDEDNNCLEPSVFIKRVCPSAWLTVVPGTGHAVNLEEPDFFNRITAEFLAQVDAGRFRLRDPRSLVKSTMAPKR